MRKILLSILLVLLIAYPIQARISRMPNQKPIHGSQIDWKHPLTAGLVGCWLINENTGDVIYDLSGNNNTGAFVSVDRKQGDINFNGINDKVLIGTTPSLSTASVTAVIRMMLNVSSGANDNIFGRTTNWLLAVNSSDVLWWAHTQNFAINTTSYTFTLGKVVDIVLSYDENTGVQIYADGVLVGSNGNTGPLDTSGIVTMGRRGDDNVSSARMDVEYGFIYDRALRANEVMQLHEDPYCFIKKPQNMALRWFGNTSGAPAAAPVFIEPKIIINITWISDEIYAWRMLYG